MRLCRMVRFCAFCAFWLLFVRLCAFFPAKMACRKAQIFGPARLQDFAREGFSWRIFCGHFFPQKREKSGGPKLKICEKSVLPTTNPKSLCKIVQKKKKHFYAMPPLVIPPSACHRIMLFSELIKQKNRKYPLKQA